MAQIPLSIYVLFSSSAFILIISLYLFFKKINLATIIFLIVGILQFLWMLSTLLMWQIYFFGFQIKPTLTAKVLSLSVFLIPAFLYHFSIEFCRIRNQKTLLFLAYVSSIGLVLSNNVSLTINELFSLNWLGLGSISLIYYFFAGYVFVLFFLTMNNFVKAWLLKGQDQEKRNTMMFILLSFGTFGLTFTYFLPTGFTNIILAFLLLVPIYTFILGYIMIERNPFATILTTDITIAMLLVLLASFIIFQGLELNLAIKSIIFVLISFLCFLLLRYMNKINNQNIEFEKMAEERTRELQEKTWRLNEANEKLEESNAVLEITIKARTKELKELNNSLEQEVQNRTKELKKKTEQLEEKVDELKQFSNIFINRENKMVELKNKIHEMESKIK